MWVEIDPMSRKISFEGVQCHHHSGSKLLYMLPSHERAPSSISDVIRCESGAAVEVSADMESVRFARDYMGRVPLLYACANQRILVTDELNVAYAWLVRQGVTPTINEESVAMYFIAGYVPQGMCVFDPIGVCRNAAIYEWHQGRVRSDDIFEEVVPRPEIDVDVVGMAIEAEVSQIANRHERIDVWCSGGIDSSTLAYLHNINGRHSDILTLSYGASLIEEFGEGEIPHARVTADACGVPLRMVDMDEIAFLGVHQSFVSGHHSPAIDTCLLAKYALANATSQVAVTGEGGDPVFGGVKNDFVTFYHHQHPSVPLGRIYSLAHKRFGPHLGQILKRGDELNAWADRYFDSLMDRYPGDLTRKLFYLNTFEKQGGMIFPESYYPTKRQKVQIYHPLTSRRVYEAAFSLTDEKRYVYPQGKLVLASLYRDKVPRSIIEREKSGTQVPLRGYLAAMPQQYFEFETLRTLSIFQDEFLDRFSLGQMTIEEDPLILYALVTLDQFLSIHRQVAAWPSFIL